MDTHKYNENDTFYRQKFDNYEVELPSDDWEVFSRKLAEVQSKRRRFVWYYVSAAASVIGILFLSLSYLYNDNSSGKTNLAHQETSRSARHYASVVSSNTSVMGQSTKKYGRITAAQKTVSTVAASRSTASGDENTGQNEAVVIVANSTAVSGSSIAKPSLVADSQPTAATNKPTVNNFDTTGYITHPVPQYAELPALSTDQTDNTPEKGKKRSSGANNLVNWLAGTFQGNLGLSSGSSDNLTIDGSIGSQLFTRVSQAELLSASSTPSLINFSGKKTYYVPLSFGITAGIPLAKRGELQSGIIYTLLITTGELGAQYSGGTKATGRIEQHYLGIPVALAYSFIQAPSFSVYLTGGGRIEKGISLVEKIYTYNSQNIATEQDSYHYAINGIQPSLDAGIGASYRLYHFIHWYVEAGGAWYIPCNQPESSRTEHPLNFSLKTGLKFSLLK